MLNNFVSIVLIIAFLTDKYNYSEACTGTGDGDGDNNNNNGDLEGIQRLLGEDIDIETFNGRSTGDAIKRPSDLDCTDPDDCRWHNVDSKEDELDYYRLVGDADSDRMDQYTGTTDVSDAPAYIVFPDDFNANSDKAFLVSDPVFCAKRQSLTFQHWMTDNVDLQVCVRFVGDVDPDECVRVGAFDNPGPTKVDLPDYEEPFELMFISNGFTDDEQFVIIDDIEYDAELCDGNNMEDKNVCPLLNCNFEPNTGCANRVSGGSRGWRTVSGTFGNRHTGIRTDAQGDQRGYYAALEGPSSSDTIDMGTFQLSEEKMLEFAYYKASFGTVFDVVVDGVTAYRDDVISGDSRQWIRAQGKIPPGQHTLEFVGSNLGPNHYIGLDELRLLDANGNQFC